MLSIREVPLSPETLQVLEDLVHASPEHASGLWQRLKSAFEGKYLSERAAEARAALARGTCEEVEVRHETPPVVAEHEHGVCLFVAAGPKQTLLLDVSSVADDARWNMYKSGTLMRECWHWTRFTNLEGAWAFAAHGAPVQPRNLGELHGTALERRLTEEMDWPGDDAVIPLSLAEIERLAHQRG